MNPIPNVPKELTEAIKTARCAGFVGAGLSVGAKYPNWSDLLKILITKAFEQHIVTAEKRAELEKLATVSGKWLMVAQELSDTFEKGQFQNEIGQIFEAVPPVPTDAHTLI